MSGHAGLDYIKGDLGRTYEMRGAYEIFRGRDHYRNHVSYHYLMKFSNYFLSSCVPPSSTNSKLGGQAQTILRGSCALGEERIQSSEAVIITEII